jgi:hypothetical protein
MAVYFAHETRISTRLLGIQLRLHSLPGDIYRVLQSTTSLDTFHHLQHARLALELQTNRQTTSEYFLDLHDFSGIPYSCLLNIQHYDGTTMCL